MLQELHSVINDSAAFLWTTLQFNVEVRWKNHHGKKAVWLRGKLGVRKNESTRICWTSWDLTYLQTSLGLWVFFIMRQITNRTTGS